MSRDSASRDRSLNVLAVMTGGLTAAALVGTGFVSGLASDYTAQKTQAKAQFNAAAASLRAVEAPAPVAPAAPVATPLPVRTVVTTRYVQAEVSAAQAQVSGRAPGAITPAGVTNRAMPARAQAPAQAAAPAPAPVPVRAAAPAPPPAPSAAS